MHFTYNKTVYLATHQTIDPYITPCSVQLDGNRHFETGLFYYPLTYEQDLRQNEHNKYDGDNSSLCQVLSYAADGTVG